MHEVRLHVGVLPYIGLKQMSRTCRNCSRRWFLGLENVAAAIALIPGCVQGSPSGLEQMIAALHRITHLGSGVAPLRILGKHSPMATKRLAFL